MAVFVPGWEYPVYDLFDTRLYTFPPLDDVSTTATTTATDATATTAVSVTENGRMEMPLPPVKVEAEAEDRFIIELAGNGEDGMDGMLPPSEVPLRATQASSEMRRMMGVFRLNPFAIHGAGTATGWCGPVGPLEEEPLVFEFQLDVGVSGAEERCTQEERRRAHGGWGMASSSSMTTTTTTTKTTVRSPPPPPPWELEYLPLEDYIPTNTPTPTSSVHRRIHESHYTHPHPYARRGSVASTIPTTASPPGSEHGYSAECMAAAVGLLGMDMGMGHGQTTTSWRGAAHGWRGSDACEMARRWSGTSVPFMI